MPVNRIVHQLWIQGRDELPLKFHSYVNQWERLAQNSKYEYKFWSEKDYWSLLVKYDMVENYTTRTNMTQKSDIARWMILYEYGGLYVDVDIEPLFAKGLPQWSQDVIVMHLPIGIFSHFTLQNAFIGIERYHSLAKIMISMMKKTTDPSIKTSGSWNYISSTTGSLLIKSIIKENPGWNILWLDAPYITFDYGKEYYLSTHPQNTEYFVVHQLSGKEECNSMCIVARIFSMFPPWWIILLVLFVIFVLWKNRQKLKI